MLLFCNKNICAGLTYLCTVLLQIWDASLLYLSEVKIMVCFKFDILFFILRKYRRIFFFRKANVLAKRVVNCREWLYFLAKIVDIFNSLINSFETCLFLSDYHPDIFLKVPFLNWRAAWITSDTFLTQVNILNIFLTFMGPCIVIIF